MILPRTRRGSLLAALVAFVPFAPVEADAADSTRRTLALGDARIDVVTRSLDGRGAAGVAAAFVSVHDDENTAILAADTVLPGHGGRLTELRHSGDREIGFRLGGRDHRIDPNRIFTPAGRRATLEALGVWSQPADDAVAAFADALLGAMGIDEADVVVALHNNTPDRYTVASYAHGGPLAADAADLHLRPHGDPDDFFFVTDRRLFDALAAKGHSVVLQHEATVADDGSLSVLCGRLGIPYVNVEAEHGHQAEQEAMLRDVVEVLESVRPKRIMAVATVPPAGCELVDLSTIDPTFVIDARYATTDNVTGRRLVPSGTIFLERSAAERLARVQASLRHHGLRLKVFDGYRPLAVQRALWRVKPDARYVADPAKGSRHNRGSAVDVTLVDGAGHELAMPSAFDEFGERSHLDFTDATPEALEHRELLQKVMRAEGFMPMPTEWWHFDAPGWRAFPVMDANPYQAALFPDGDTTEQDPP